MFRYECSVCHGNCDPGELVNGVCLECLEKKRLSIVTQNKVIQLLNAPWEQMKLNLGGKGYGFRNS